jgi:SAM-dependent methyltransferase
LRDTLHEIRFTNNEYEGLDTGHDNHPARSGLVAHLHDWGLRHFTSDAAYFDWQRRAVAAEDLNRLHGCLAKKQAAGAGPLEEIAFYDATAEPSLIPALYSQRYEYYLAVGSRAAPRIPPATNVLDFGCGIGILTTFFACQYPDRQFVGIDRSPASIAYARRRAADLKLANVAFESIDLDREPGFGRYDLVIATHALLQAEQDPGLPSDRWDTFTRSRDAARQASFEERTGLVPRLDRLVELVSDSGRMLIFEKARLLSRRIPFQRALAARGFALKEPAEPIRYSLVEEVAEDGPLYLVGRQGDNAGEWNELPEHDESAPVNVESLKQRQISGEEPLYENHEASAQAQWMSLPDRRVVREFTKEGPDGRQLHAEFGRTRALLYLYVANTFDQRQLIMIEQDRAPVLESYYAEIEKGG